MQNRTEGVASTCLKADFPGDTCHMWHEKYGQELCSVCSEDISRLDRLWSETTVELLAANTRIKYLVELLEDARDDMNLILGHYNPVGRHPDDLSGTWNMVARIDSALINSNHGKNDDR